MGMAEEPMGVAPERARQRGRGALAKPLVDFWFLFLGQAFEIRTRWFWFIFQMTFVPVSFLLFLWLLIGRDDPAAMLYVITGNVTQGIAMSGMLSLGQEIGGMKDAQTFEFFASLPVSKLGFISAMLFRATVFTIPASVLVFVVGSLFFDLSFQFHPLLLLLIPLGGLSLSGLGALVGFYSPNGKVAGLATQVLNPIIVFLAPVFIAREALPPLLDTTSSFIPTTYLAEALRDCVTGTVGPQTYLAILVLGGFAIVSLWLVAAKVDWRARD